MFKFGEGALGDEIKDTEIVNNDFPVFESNITVEDATAFWDKQFETVPEISMKDILNKNEEDFSFEDFDIAELSEIISKFDENIWSDLSLEERIDIVKSAVEKISGKLELEEIPEVIYFEDDPSNCGYYYEGLNMLGINSCELDYPKELLNTISHELRHAYQRQRASNPETEMDYKYLANLNNYISPLFTETGECILFTDYQDQLVEAEARAFANMFSREGMTSWVK